MVRFDYSDDYFETFVKKIKSLNLDNTQTRQKKFVYPDNLVWVVVGDRSKIEQVSASLVMEK